MKAVIYARYSSDNQREESIEGQIRECTAFAEKNDITILKHYIDRAYSARTDNRPEFQAMIKDSDKRLFDMVIVWKLDRFSRDRYDSTRYKLQLKKNGVKVVSATEQISEGAEGIILESVLEGYAEYYSADLAEKVHRGMTENALKGKCNGGTRPVGYIIDAEQHFQPDPVTAPFVLEAFKRYAEGSTMKEIAAFFKENGIRNTLGGEIKPGSIQRMLNNRRYIGEYSYKDVIVPNAIPAIVPQNLFDRVQNMMVKNKKAPARHKAEDDYLLTTKLFCGYCGAYLCGECGTSRSGVVHHYYKCVSVKKRREDCKKKAVRKEWIEDLVVSATMKMLMNDATVDAIVAALMELQKAENSLLPLYEKQLRDTNNAIQNLLSAIEQGLLTRSTKERLDELEAARDNLESKIACEKLSKPRISEEQLRFFLHRFRSMNVEQQSQRKMLIDTFVNAIFLYDDRLVITYNFHEGSETITLNDLHLVEKKSKSGSDIRLVGEPNESMFLTGHGFFCAPAACLLLQFICFRLEPRWRTWYNGRRNQPSFAGASRARAAKEGGIDMIRRSSEKETVRKPAPFHGVGEITVRSILNGDPEMEHKGRVFGHTTVYPGSEIGYHIHNGDSETYYILSGRGRYNDNGTIVEIGPGDVTYCAPGEGHGLACIGEEPVEMIALILYA